MPALQTDFAVAGAGPCRRDVLREESQPVGRVFDIADEDAGSGRSRSRRVDDPAAERNPTAGTDPMLPLLPIHGPVPCRVSEAQASGLPTEPCSVRAYPVSRGSFGDAALSGVQDGLSEGANAGSGTGASTDPGRPAVPLAGQPEAAVAAPGSGGDPGLRVRLVRPGDGRAGGAARPIAAPSAGTDGLDSEPPAEDVSPGPSDGREVDAVSARPGPDGVTPASAGLASDGSAADGPAPPHLPPDTMAWSREPAPAGPPRHLQGPAEHAQPVLQHLVQTAPAGGGAEVEVTLSPGELGHLRMTLLPDDGAMTLTILAERAETLDLMRRHIDELAGDLRDLGFGALDFRFRHQGGPGNGAGSAVPFPADDGSPGHSLLPTIETHPVLPLPERVAEGRLDLRI